MLISLFPSPAGLGGGGGGGGGWCEEVSNAPNSHHLLLCHPIDNDWRECLWVQLQGEVNMSVQNL